MVLRKPLPRILVCGLLVTALLAVALPASVTASPRPVAVCEPCTDGFVSAAHANGVDVRIEHSTATMRVHRNGSATWTVENRLNATAAEALRNDTLRRDVAEEAVAAHDATLLSTGVDGDTVRIRYRTPDAATETAGGVLRVEQFRDDPGRRIYTELGADRLTLVAPEGMVVERGLPGADTSGRRTTVTTFHSEGDGPFVTLVPAETTLGPLWSFAAVALPLAPIVGRNLLSLVAVPTLVFVVGLGAVPWLASAVSLDRNTTPNRRAHAVVALGVILAAHPLYVGAVGLGSSTPALVAGAVGAVALGGVLSGPSVRARLSTGRLAAIVALSFAVAVAAGYLLRALPLGAFSFRTGAPVARSVVPTLPVYAAALVGYATARANRRRGLAVAAGAFAIAMVATTAITAQAGQFYGLEVILRVFGAVAAVVAGLPLLWLGAGVADPRSVSHHRE